MHRVVHKSPSLRGNSMETVIVGVIDHKRNVGKVFGHRIRVIDKKFLFLCDFERKSEDYQR